MNETALHLRAGAGAPLYDLERGIQLSYANYQITPLSSWVVGRKSYPKP